MPVTPPSSEDELSYFEKFMSHAKTPVAAATSSSQNKEEMAQEPENGDTPMDTSTAETEFESLEAALAVDANAPNVMIQSPPENDHLVNNDSTPVSYPSAEAMPVDEPMTDDDGNSAAAIVDFEMGQQQMQQHLQDAALDDSDCIMSEDQQLIYILDMEAFNNGGIFQIGGPNSNIISVDDMVMPNLIQPVQKTSPVYTITQIDEESEDKNEASEEENKEEHEPQCTTTITPVAGPSFTCQRCQAHFEDQELFFDHLRAYYDKPKPAAISSPQEQPENAQEEENGHNQEELHETEEGPKNCRADTENTEPTAKPVVKNDIEKHSFQCTQCDKYYPCKKSLGYHMRTHNNTRRSFQCDQCGKSYVARGGLRNHMMSHTDERPHVCEACGKKFRQKGDLEIHMASLHSNNKPFRCKYCGYVTARKYCLDVHIRKHTEEKNYKCQFCDMKFRTSSYRLNHEKTHTGEKNHKCEVCGKCFSVPFSLRRHRKIHNKKPTTRTGRRSKAQCSTQESTSGTDINDDTTEEIYHVSEVEEEEDSEEVFEFIVEEASPEINGTLYVMISRSH